jgi:hypothetical protein
MQIQRRKFLSRAAALGAAALVAPRVVAAQDGPISKAIPSSGECIPVIGIGTNRYRSGDPALVARLRDTLAAFAARGGGVVDTAPGYGDSESVIGGILRETGIRERLFLATKVDRGEKGAVLEFSCRTLHWTDCERSRPCAKVHSSRSPDRVPDSIAHPPKRQGSARPPEDVAI